MTFREVGEPPSPSLDPNDWLKYNTNVQFESFDQKITIIMDDGKPKFFDPIGLDGNTTVSALGLKEGDKPQIIVLGRASIMVPGSPKIAGKNGRPRDVGDGVKLVIALHELIHASGLHKHSKLGTDLMGEKFVAVNKGRPGIPGSDDPEYDVCIPDVVPLNLNLVRRTNYLLVETANLIRDNWK